MNPILRDAAEEMTEFKPKEHFFAAGLCLREEPYVSYIDLAMYLLFLAYAVEDD